MKSKNGYKAIFFDLDGTLRHTKPLGSDVYREKAEKLGFKVSDEAHRKAGRWEHLYWANSSELKSDSKKFQGDADAFWGNYASLRLSEMGATKEELDELVPKLRTHFTDDYDPKNWVPPELYQILPALRSAGYTLAVLSNRRDPFTDVLDELSLSEYFDAVLAAGEFKMWKPNPKAFSPLLEKFDLAPKDTVYVGDNYYADVIGARNAGLVPILYDPRGLFIEEDCTRITSFNELGAHL